MLVGWEDQTLPFSRAPRDATGVQALFGDQMLEISATVCEHQFHLARRENKMKEEEGQQGPSCC